MQEKILKIFLYFEVILFELVLLETRFYWERILVIGYQYTNKQSQDFRYYENRTFWADFLYEWSKNMKKILPFRFGLVSDPLTCWLFITVATRGFLGTEGTGFLQSLIWETNNPWGSSSFSKYSRFYVDSGNAEKNWENNFWFLRIYIWIGFLKHSHLLRENTCHRVWIYQQNVSRL